MWGKYPSTGRPVSRSNIGARLANSMGEQSLRKIPRIQLFSRKEQSPLICAAKVKLAPLGRTTNSTGISKMDAKCQALACVVLPPTPS